MVLVHKLGANDNLREIELPCSPVRGLWFRNGFAKSVDRASGPGSLLSRCEGITHNCLDKSMQADSITVRIAFDERVVAQFCQSSIERQRINSETSQPETRNGS